MIITSPPNGRKPSADESAVDRVPLLVPQSASSLYLLWLLKFTCLDPAFPQRQSRSLSKDLVICCLDTAAAVSPPLIHFNWKVIVMQTLLGIICGSVLLELPQLTFPPN